MKLLSSFLLFVSVMLPLPLSLLFLLLLRRVSFVVSGVVAVIVSFTAHISLNTTIILYYRSYCPSGYCYSKCYLITAVILVVIVIVVTMGSVGMVIRRTLSPTVVLKLFVAL